MLGAFGTQKLINYHADVVTQAVPIVHKLGAHTGEVYGKSLTLLGQSFEYIYSAAVHPRFTYFSNRANRRLRFFNHCFCSSSLVLTKNFLVSLFHIIVSKGKRFSVPLFTSRTRRDTSVSLIIMATTARSSKNFIGPPLRN